MDNQQNATVEANRLRITIKDLFTVASVLVVMVGSWYSQNAQLSKLAVEIQADKQILELRLAQMQAEILRLEAETKLLREKLDSR